MDVLDRTTRLDVVTATSAPASVGTPSNSPSFADSLSRPGRTTSSGVSDGPSKQSSRSPAGETASTRTTSKPNPDAPAANSSAASKAQNSTPPADDASRSIDPEAAATTAADSSEAEEETIPILMAGLITAAAVAPPGATPTAKSVAPALTPPASLIAALQAPVEIQTASAKTEEPPPQSPLPAIPVGLQMGLAQRTDSVADNAIVDKQQVTTANPNDSAVQAVPTGARIQESAPAIQGVPVSDMERVTAQAPAKLSATAKTPTEISAPKPTSSNDSPASQATSIDGIAKSQETTTIGSQPDGQLVERQPVIPAGQKPAAAKPKGDAVSRDDLLNFSTDNALVAAVPTISPYQSGSNVGMSRPMPQESAANLSPTDAMPISAVPGQAPIPLSFDSTNLMAGSTAPASSQTPNLVEQLQPVLHQAMSQDREMTMTLRPPELGAVRIDVQHRDGLLSARLHTETAAAHQLLTEQLPQLREVLTQMGVAADQVQVIRSETPQNSSQAGFLADRQADAQQSGGQQESQQHAPEPQRIDDPEQDDAQRPAILTRTALNLRI